VSASSKKAVSALIKALQAALPTVMFAGRQVWRGVIFPFLLLLCVIFIMALIVVTTGIIQLQLRMHQAQVQDSRFGTDVLQSFVQQASDIDKFEYEFQPLSATVLQFMDESARFAENLLFASDYTCNKAIDIYVSNLKTPPSADSDIVKKRADYVTQCQDVILRRITASALSPESFDVSDKEKFRSKFVKEVIPQISDISIQTNPDLEAAVSVVANYYLAFYTDGLKQKESLEKYVTFCSKLNEYLSTSKNLSILAQSTIEGAKYEFYKCTYAALISPGSILPFGLIQYNGSTSLNPDKLVTTQNPINDKRDVDGDRVLQNTMVSELLFSYRFYRNYLGPSINNFIVAPIDLSFMLLVLFSSLLGAFLRFIFDDIQRTQRAINLEGKKSGETNFSAMYPASLFIKQALVSVMVGLLFYVLCRTTLVSMLDRTVAEGTFSLNPYLVSFIAAVAGILSTETFQKIVDVGGGLIKSSSGARNKHQPPTVPGANP
jgi:hypothetical protein